MSLGREEIDHRFGTHKSRYPEGHAEIRIDFKKVARALDRRLPDGREKDEAMRHLEEASMWAHKALSMDGALLVEEPPKEIDTSEERVSTTGMPPERGWP